MARRLHRPAPAPDYAVDTEVGQGSRLADVELGDYSYCDLANTTVGKFSNIASFAGVPARVIRFHRYEQGPSTPPLDSSALCGHRPD